jgi:hypothetical protein
VDGRAGAAGRRLTEQKIIRQDEPGSADGRTTSRSLARSVRAMRARLFLALLVLAILLLALGGLVVRSTASGLRVVTSP